LLLITLCTGLLIGFSSCNEMGKGNSGTYADVWGVVDFDINMGGTVVSTAMGTIATPALMALNPGDCVYLSRFTIDYDNQPSDKYYTATEITYTQISKTVVFPWSSSDYVLPLSNVLTLTDPFFKGNLFVSADFSKSKEQAVNFRLWYDANEPLREGGAVNVYLQAQLAGTASSAVEKTSDVWAYDMSSLFGTFGRDTTVNTVSYKYVNINLAYLSEIEKGEPVYANAATNPVLITMFKEN
jgi:hypothetical protein